MRAVALAVLALVVLDELDQLPALGRLGSAQSAQRKRRAGENRRPRDLVGLVQRGCDLGHLRRVDAPQDGYRTVALLADRGLVRLPRQVPGRLDGLLVGRFPAFDLLLAREARLDDPVALPRDAVV